MSSVHTETGLAGRQATELEARNLGELDVEKRENFDLDEDAIKRSVDDEFARRSLDMEERALKGKKKGGKKKGGKKGGKKKGAAAVPAACAACSKGRGCGLRCGSVSPLTTQAKRSPRPSCSSKGPVSQPGLLVTMPMPSPAASSSSSTACWDSSRQW